MSSHPRQDAVIRTYIGLLLLSFCVYAIMYAPQPMYNSISREFGVDKGTTGLLVSVCMLSLAIAPLCVGVLIGKLGSRLLLLGSTFLLGATGYFYYSASSFPELMAVRVFQSILIPVALTATMATISHVFRHMDLNRALAGYVSSNLVGSFSGRVFGGWLASMFGWRLTLAIICVIFFLCLALLWSLPADTGGSRKPTVHSLSEYLPVLREKGVGSLVFVEACGLFVFAAVGNLVPFRMAELGYGKSEFFIGLMYVGYSIGIFASLCIAPLLKIFKKEMRLILFGSVFFALSLITLAIPSIWMLFAGIWLISIGEFLIHGTCPGIINHLSSYDRGMINGLYLSCYYLGGVAGSAVPVVLYSHFGWFPCYLIMQLVLVISLLVVISVFRRMPDIH